MNKRNIIASILALTVAGSIAACGGGADENYSYNPPAATTQTPNPPDSPTTKASDSAAEPAPTEQAEQSLSPEVENARESAQNYLSFQAFSKLGLIEQLSSKAGDGYPKAVATKAVNSLDVNYNEQAVKAAKNYLSIQSFSRSGLVEQLESPYGDHFTHAQAVYGVNHAYGK